MTPKLLKLYKLSVILGSVLICLAANRAPAQSLLWEVSGNGLEKPSYLFGTIHVLCSEGFSLDENVLDALNNTERIMLEMDMDDAGFAKKMQSIALDPQRRNIKSALSDQHVEKINSFLTSNYGITLDQVGMMRPFMVQSMVIAKIPGCKQPASYEGKFVELAAKNGLEVLGLEEVEDQVAVFDKIGYQKLVALIAESVINSQKTKEQYDAMTKRYKDKNIEGLHDYIIQSPELKGYEDILMYNRNKRWIPKIEKLIREQPTFIAFGAGHLGSEKGVINLLRKKGFTLNPVLNLNHQ